MESHVPAVPFNFGYWVDEFVRLANYSDHGIEQQNYALVSMGGIKSGILEGIFGKSVIVTEPKKELPIDLLNAEGSLVFKLRREKPDIAARTLSEALGALKIQLAQEREIGKPGIISIQDAIESMLEVNKTLLEHLGPHASLAIFGNASAFGALQRNTRDLSELICQIKIELLRQVPALETALDIKPNK